MLKFIVGAVLALLFWKWVLLGLVLWGAFKFFTRPRYVVVERRRF
jgi:hypothetical protein